MAISKVYGGEITVDPVNHVVAIPNANGSTAGLQLGATIVTASAAELNTLSSSGVSNADLVKLHAVTRTAAQLNKVMASPVSVTGAGALSQASNAGMINVINSAAGIAITLPAATGTGDVYRCIIGTSVTSGSTTITAAGSDKFYGVVLQSKAATTVANYNATGSSSIFTMDGSTKGGLVGDEIVFVDIGSAKWALKAHIQGTGVIASPLS